MKDIIVTLGIIAYNEEKYLPQLLRNIVEQTYPINKIEIVLVDGKSEDDTLKIMKKFAEDNTNFLNVKVCINEKRTQPSGWNVVIKQMTGDILIRIDSHALIPNDFVKKNVECIERGEFVCGGPRTNIIDENTRWKRVLLAAEQSLFGSGIAPYRRDKSIEYVKTVFHAAYHREVIETVGLFNEELLRTEDNEYHYRVRKHGYKICYDHNISSSYQTRNSLKKMIKQKYSNGLWIGKTIWKCPGCISLFHLVPCVFVLSLIISMFLFLLQTKWIFIFLVLLYMCICFILMISCWLKDVRNYFQVCLMFIFPILHISYGIGTIVGIFKGLKW